MTPLLVDRFPSLSLGHQSLGNFPTPLECHGRVAGSARLWVKREDVSASAYGGNKVRKLEWLLPAAREAGAPVLSIGATGSNHLVATAVHGERLGVELFALVVPQPSTPHVEKNARLLAQKAKRVWPCRSRFWVPWVGWKAWRWIRRECGTAPMWITAGGSNALGTVGWVEAGLELGRQVEAGEMEAPTDVFVALGSGGTVAGLLIGLALAGLSTRLHAVRVMDRLFVNHRQVLRLARRCRALLLSTGASLPPLDSRGLHVDHSVFGRGYGHPNPRWEALASQASSMGMALEPTYSGKAFEACLAAMEQGRTGAEVLFVDTVNSRPLDALLRP